MNYPKNVHLGWLRAFSTTRLSLAIALFFYALPLPAQEDQAEDDAQVSGLELFDEDAENTRQGWAQLHAAAGFMYLDADGSFSVRTAGGNDLTIIDFDRAGLDEKDSSYWVSINWRSAHSRWGSWFGSWRYDVTGSRLWDGAGLGIPAGASVTSEFDAQWYIFEATYSFYRSKTVDAGIGLGIHVVDLDTNLRARIEGADRAVEIISADLDTIAPLPNGLAYVFWKFAPRFSLTARLGYFTLDYDKYSGEMTNAHVLVNYFLSERWALGASYQFVELDLDVEKTDYTQIYDINFSGPMLFARFSF
jgi:hypothetical protein